MKKLFLIVTLFSVIGNISGNQDPRTAMQALENRMIQMCLQEKGLDNNRIVQHLQTNFKRTANASDDCHYVMGYFTTVDIFEIDKDEKPDLTNPENQRDAAKTLFMFENIELQKCLEHHFDKKIQKSQNK